MCVQDQIADFYSNSDFISPEKFSGIIEVFKVWAQAFDLASDRTQTDIAKADAARKMEELWDAARAFTARTAADVAAIYIMGQNTTSIEADAYLESAWRIVHTASGEANLVQHYETWVQLRTTSSALNLNDTVGDGIYAVIAELETKIAAIPANTAKGLAVKVDVFGGNVETDAGRMSLDRDLATLTGQGARLN